MENKSYPVDNYGWYLCKRKHLAGCEVLFYGVHDPGSEFVDGFFDQGIGFIESGDFLNVRQNCGMVFSEGFSDFLVGKGQKLSAEIHGNLSCQGYLRGSYFGFELTGSEIVVFAYGIDDVIDVDFAFLGFSDFIVLEDLFGE